MQRYLIVSCILFREKVTTMISRKITSKENHGRPWNSYITAVYNSQNETHCIIYLLASFSNILALKRFNMQPHLLPDSSRRLLKSIRRERNIISSFTQIRNSNSFGCFTTIVNTPDDCALLLRFKYS